MSTHYQAALHAWQLNDPYQKVQACLALWTDAESSSASCPDTGFAAFRHAVENSPSLQLDPGRPEQPQLVEPRMLKRRRLGSIEGRQALLHAIAHIEFNAINLALDAVLRFADMPTAYYRDWLSVAADEARHFQLLADRLQQLGIDYGDLPAHNGLWEMAEKTAHDVLVRMALVPRVLEARGLDVTPGMIDKLQAVGDSDSVAVLQIILEEEVRHVEIGSHWFRYCCAARQLQPDAMFAELLQRYFAGGIRLPLNLEARGRADFSAQELAMLQRRANA